MRHLLSAKIALIALLLLGFALPAAAAPGEAAASTFVADISAFFGELVANIFATEAPADPEVVHSFPPGGQTATETGEEPEVASSFPPNGQTAAETGEDPEVAHSFPPHG